MYWERLRSPSPSVPCLMRHCKTGQPSLLPKHCEKRMEILLPAAATLIAILSSLLNVRAEPTYATRSTWIFSRNSISEGICDLFSGQNFFRASAVFLYGSIAGVFVPIQIPSSSVECANSLLQFGNCEIPRELLHMYWERLRSPSPSVPCLMRHCKTGQPSLLPKHCEKRMEILLPAAATLIAILSSLLNVRAEPTYATRSTLKTPKETLSTSGRLSRI